MEAGSRADEQAHRIAARLTREREALAAAQARIDATEARHRAWQAGADGERATAAALDQLAASGWLLLHDAHWPGRPMANVDHVAVGPGGVVVIDSKNWSYPATVRGGHLWTGRYPKRRECDDVARMVAAVAALLAPVHRSLVLGSLCLVQQDLEATRAEPGVVVIGLGQLAAYLRSLPVVLQPSDVHGVHDWLAVQLAAASSPAQLTTAAFAEGAMPRGRFIGSRSPRASGRMPARSASPQRLTARDTPRLRRAALTFLIAVVGLWTMPMWLGAAMQAVSEGLEQRLEQVEPSQVGP